MKVRFVLLSLLFVASSAMAQLLPDNTSLNANSLARWMQSNREFAPLIQVIDELNSTAESLAAFENLSTREQDVKIQEFLQRKNVYAAAKDVAQRHGWNSIGEYMRFSTTLGNAIAAYFLLGDLSSVSEEGGKALRDKADPAILAVPKSDIEFVRAHEKILKQYIQAYGLSRVK